MVLGGGSFGGWLGHEGGVLVNGISALIKDTPESSLSLLPCEGTTRRQLSMNKEAVLHQILNLVVPCSWTSLLPEL